MTNCGCAVVERGRDGCCASGACGELSVRSKRVEFPSDLDKNDVRISKIMSYKIGVLTLPSGALRMNLYWNVVSAGKLT